MTTFFNDPRIGRRHGGKTVWPEQTIDGQPYTKPKQRDTGEWLNVPAAVFGLGDDGYFAVDTGHAPRDFDFTAEVEKLTAKVGGGKASTSTGSAKREPETNS